MLLQAEEVKLQSQASLNPSSSSLLFMLHLKSWDCWVFCFFYSCSCLNFTSWNCFFATCINYWLRDTKRMCKTNQGFYAILLNPVFCSSHHVWSRLQCVHTSSFPRVPSLWFRYCDQAGSLVALGALEKRGQWLHLFPTEKDYRSWRPWLITQRQTSEYGQGKVQLFNSSHTQSIQTSCWRSFSSSPCSFFSVTIAFYCLSLPIYGSRNYLGRRVVVIVGVLGRFSVLYFHWRWVPFFFVRE